MFRYGLVGIYFSYLLISGTGMASAINHADHSNSQQLKANVCMLMNNGSGC